jgi:hypothetical protein
MYQFTIIREKDGVYRFELDGINLLLDSYTLKEGKHFINNPSKAIAFFNLNGHVYSVSNNIHNLTTAEDLFDSIRSQYAIFLNQNHDGFYWGDIVQSA